VLISLVILTYMCHDARFTECKTKFVILCDAGIYEDSMMLKSTRIPTL